MLTALLMPLMLLCPAVMPPTATPTKPGQLTTVHISTEQWQGFTHQDHSGAYFDLVRLLLPPEQYKLKVTFTNYNRALALVRQQKADMTLAVSGHNSKNLLLSAKPIDQDQIVAIYHPEVHQLNTVADLKSLRLAWNLAYDFGAILGLASVGYEVPSVQNGVELALNQRIDVYLAEQSQIEHYEQSGQLTLRPLVAKTIAADDIYAAFANNESGQRLKCLWDQHFDAALANGQLKQLYQRHANFYLLPE